MNRVAIATVLWVVGCGYHLERDTPDPPPPEPSTATAAPATTTPDPAPTTAPATTTTPAPHATHVPAPSTAPAPTTEAHAGASATCTSAFHCCQAAVAAMPIGGLVSGCSELRDADSSRDDECRQLIATYRATLEQVGATIPAACHAPH